MTIRKKIVACLLLLPGLLLLGAWGSPPAVIPSCPTCKVTIFPTNWKVEGTVTYMSRTYSSTKVVLKYPNEQPYSLTPVPTVNMPFSKTTSPRVTRPQSAQIWFCNGYGGSTLCDKLDIPVQ